MISGCSGEKSILPPDAGAVPQSVKCEFALISIDADEDHGAMGRFTFQHHEAHAIDLYGFGFSGTNTFRVRFEGFQRETDGKWSEVQVGYCGTGAELYPIEPHREYVFLVPLWPFLEEGGHGIVEIPGIDLKVVSMPFSTAEVRKIGDRRKKTANRRLESDRR